MNTNKLQVFIFRPLLQDEVESLNALNGAVSIVSNDARFVANLNFGVTLIDSEMLIVHEDYARDVIQNFGHTELASGETLVGCTTFKNVVLWHPVRFGIYHKFKDGLVQKSIIDTFGSGGEIAIRVYTRVSEVVDLCPNVEVRVDAVATKKTKTVSAPKFMLLFLIRSLVGLFRNGFPPKRKRLIFNSVSPLVPMVDVDGVLSSKGIASLDYFLQKIEVDEDYAFVSPMKFIGVKDGLFPFWEICFSSYPRSKVYHFESFVLMALLKVNSIWQLHVYWRSLAQATLFDQSNVSKVLFADFKRRKIQFLYAAVLTLGGFRMIRKMDPMCIGGDDEHNFVKRPILGAAKELGVPTFAIQHGDIHRNNINYRFSKRDPLERLLPDMTAVWGNLTKVNLIEVCAYSADSIKVVGQIRTDVIPALKRKFAEKSDQRMYTVLFASQPFFDQSLRKRMYSDVNKASQNLEDVKFIHKPHPGETDWSFFDDIDKDLGFKVQRTDEDLYLIMAQVDAVVTGFSTVGIEATYFDRDIIVMDYQRDDLAGYVKDQIALQATNHEELFSYVARLSKGENLLSPITRRTYVQQRVLDIDGKASQRLKEAIETL